MMPDMGHETETKNRLRLETSSVAAKNTRSVRQESPFAYKVQERNNPYS
jgi:hypothetical protein